MYKNSYSLYFGRFYADVRKWCKNNSIEGCVLNVDDFCEHHKICKKCKGIGCIICGQEKMPYKRVWIPKRKKISK